MQGIVDTFIQGQGIPLGNNAVMFLPFINLALIFIGLSFIGAFILKYLWNMTLPGIFKLPEITYWEAFRLILIAWILFGRG